MACMPRPEVAHRAAWNHSPVLHLARPLHGTDESGSTPSNATLTHPSPVRRADCGGFDFMPRPGDEYYRQLPARIGKALSAEQYKAVEELGLLVDADDQVSHVFACQTLSTHDGQCKAVTRMWGCRGRW